VVRVQLQLTPQQNALLREPALIEALRPAFFVAGVARTIQQERRRRVSNGAELRLRPEEAVRLWLQATDRPADYSETLLDHARRVIEAEDGAAGADDTDAATARED
jgi:hypothetical protein